jgi:diketogulonate reductase-like aldo/keto reductase
MPRAGAILVVCAAAAAVAPVSRRSLLKTTGAAAVATPLAANAADKQPLLAAGSIAVPRVGFGLYKTAPEETKAAVALALEAGVRHFDTAASYNNEAELGAALREGDTGENVFVATKVAVTAGASARDAVAAAADRLKRAPDCVYVHSPLAPKERRLETWAALNEARREGLCRAVGAANCGLRHLKEFEIAGPAPALVQLELSPYNQRPAEVAWARGNRAVVTCAAWSKLSGAYNWGSDAAYKTLNAACKAHGATKAQVLVRWALQRGFVPLPRSGVSDSVQRLAIAQNSLSGVEDGVTWRGGQLSAQEMRSLNQLEDRLASGRLGRTDGWTADQVEGPDWDPTTYVD